MKRKIAITLGVLLTFAAIAVYAAGLQGKASQHAGCHQHGGNPTDIVLSCSEILKNTTSLTDKTRVRFLTAQALAEHQLGKSHRALQRVAEALTLAPSSTAALDTHAKILRLSGTLRPTLSRLTQSLQANANQTNLRWQRAFLFAELGQTDNAIQDLEHIVEKSSSDTDWFASAYLFDKVGEVSRARLSVKKAIRNTPEDPEAKRLRAKLLLKSGGYSEAIVDLNEIVNQNSYDICARIYRARAYAKLRLFGRALKDLDKAHQQAPNNTWVLRERANVFMAQNDAGAALVDLNRALEIEPDNAKTWRARAHYYEQTNAPGTARQDIAKSLELDPNFQWALRKHAVLLSATRHTKRTHEAVEAALKVFPADPDLLRIRADVLRATGLYKQALVAINAAISIAPNSRRAYVSRAKIMKALGNMPRARADFNIALSLDERRKKPSRIAMKKNASGLLRNSKLSAITPPPVEYY